MCDINRVATVTRPLLNDSVGPADLSAGSPPTAVVGTELAEFHGPTTASQTLSVSSFVGRVPLVIVVASSPVEIERAWLALEDLQRPSEPMQFLLVARTSIAALEADADGRSVPALADPSGRIAELLGVGSASTALAVSLQGIIVAVERLTGDLSSLGMVESALGAGA